MVKIHDNHLGASLFPMPCINCRHFNPNEERSCKAFELIPEEIWEGKNQHRRPFPGDKNITFSPK